MHEFRPSEKQGVGVTEMERDEEGERRRGEGQYLWSSGKRRGSGAWHLSRWGPLNPGPTPQPRLYYLRANPYIYLQIETIPLLATTQPLALALTLTSTTALDSITSPPVYQLLDLRMVADA